MKNDNNISPSQKLLNYTNLVKEDLKITEYTIQDNCFEIPQKKHYWVGIMITEKQNLNKLLKKKKNLETEILKKQSSDSVSAISTDFSPRTMKNMIENTDTMKSLNAEIEEQQLLNEYLDHVVKIFSFITNDVKNIIEAINLQNN